MCELKLSDLEEKHMPVKAAHGYAELGMWDDVQRCLRELPDHIADHPSLHPLQLKLATATKDFSGGAELVWRHLLFSDEDLETAGWYMLGFARFALEADNMGLAAGALALARKWVPALQESINENAAEGLPLSDETVNKVLRVAGLARCRYLSALADTAAENGDTGRALLLTQEAQALLESLPGGQE